MRIGNIRLSEYNNNMRIFNIITIIHEIITFLFLLTKSFNNEFH